MSDPDERHEDFDYDALVACEECDLPIPYDEEHPLCSHCEREAREIADEARAEARLEW
jgi:Zn finger protein HypA/HybF involved in hydrogenase expression